MEVEDQQIENLKKNQNHLFMAEIIFPCGPKCVENVEKQYEDQNELDKNRNIKKIELEFCDIYQQATRKIFDTEDESNLLYLRRFFRIFLPLVNTWCAFNKSAKKQKDKDFTRLLTSSLYYRLTYIYRNCVVLSSVVAFHFQNVLMDNPLFCQKLQQKKSVKICSLGSGPASEIVGIVQVLETVSVTMNIELEVFVTIIDSDLGWKNAAMVVLSGLKQFHGAVWKITFIEADLSHVFSPSTLKAMKDADILTMVNFVSEFTRTILPKKKSSTLLQTFEKITDIILPGSMLYVLDFSKKDIIQACGGHTGKILNFNLIYEELSDFYTLQASTVGKLFVQYHGTFPSFGCNRTLKAFVRAWVRRFPDESDRMSPDRLSQKNRFLITRENQNSLNTNNYFQNWEHRFREEMSKLGWNRRGINKFISGHKEKRSRLLKQHFNQKKLVNEAREKLMEPDEEGDTKVIEENAMDEYLKAKSDFNCIKKDVYGLSIFNFKCNLKRNKLGYPKKHK